MNKVQERVVDLVNSATPKEELEKWTRGYIPKHYKSLSIPMSKAKELAILGASECIACFNMNPFFTQSLIVGAVISGEYKTLVIVTTSQYGKSYTMGRLGNILAYRGHKVHIAAGTEHTTSIIMKEVLSSIQDAHDDIKSKLLETKDKIEKLQSSVSKKNLTYKDGGSIDVKTLGISSNDPLKGNQAVGSGGDYIIDEADLVTREAFAEVGRRDFSNVDGEKDLLIMISNPHTGGIFYEFLTDENPPDDTLIIWMDVRTAVEEGRIKGLEQVTNSTFFREKSTCQRYLLCELQNYSEESMFNSIRIDDSDPNPSCTYFLGVDSAYKGKDNIDVCLSCVDTTGNIRILDIVSIEKPKEWKDGVTSEYIIDEVMKIRNTFRVRFVCVDIGFGVYLVEGLAKRAVDFQVLGINFGAGTTKLRKEANHYSAVFGSNMRAEMYLDLQQLMDGGKLTLTTKVAKMVSKQMLATKTIPKAGGKTAIISKDMIKTQIGHSPDELDSCVLSVHSALLYSMKNSVFIHEEKE